MKLCMRRAVFSVPSGVTQPPFVAICRSTSLNRICGRLVAPRACEIALMVKTRSNGLSASSERSPQNAVRVGDFAAFALGGCY